GRLLRRVCAGAVGAGRRPACHRGLARRGGLRRLGREPGSGRVRTAARRARRGRPRGGDARGSLRGHPHLMSRYRVSMDIGGTFTDVVAYDEETGSYTAGKSSTTPRDLTEGVLVALFELGKVAGSPADCGFTVHGTTQG